MRARGQGGIRQEPAAGTALDRTAAVLRRWARYPYTLVDPRQPGPAEQPAKAGPWPFKRPQSPFTRLAWVHTLSSSGDAMVAVALAGSIFFNVSTKAAESKVALSLALTVAPFAIVGPLLGPLVERARGGRRAIVVSSAGGRVVCCFLMAMWAHSLALFPVAFFTLVFSKLYLVTKAALVPGAVDHSSQLVLANSKLSVGGSVAGTVAGVFGAGVLKLVGAAGLLRFDMVVYLACAWGAAHLTNTLRASSTLPPPATAHGPLSDKVDAEMAGSLSTGTEWAGTDRAGTETAGTDWTVTDSAGAETAGTDWTVTDRAGADRAGADRVGRPTGPTPPLIPVPLGLPPGGLQLAALATAALRCSVGFVTFLLVFTFRRNDAALIWYGLALGASQVGNVAGALLAPRLRRRAREEWILTLSSIVVGAAALTAGIVDWGTHWTFAVMLAAGIGLAAGSGKVAFDSMVQRDVPSRVRGRSFARFESGFQLAWAVGSLCAVLVPMTLSAGFIAIGAIGLLGAGAFTGGSIKARRGTLPAWFPGSAPRPTAPPRTTRQ